MNNNNKKDINLLLAAGIKKGVDFKASVSLIMIIVLVVAIGAMGIMYISAMGAKNDMIKKVADYNAVITSATTKIKLDSLMEKQKLNEEIIKAVGTGNAILDYINSSNSIFVKLSSTDLVNIIAFSSGVGATYTSHAYVDNTITITFEVQDSMISEIPIISAECIKAITDIYKSDTVLKPFVDNKLTIVEQEDNTMAGKHFTLTAKMQNYFDLLKYAGVEIKNFSFNKGNVKFDAVAGAPSADQKAIEAANVRITQYGISFKNGGKPLYFSSVSTSGTEPTRTRGKNALGVDYDYFTLSFTCNA